MEKENSLEDNIGNIAMVQAALLAMPDLPKLYPKFLNILDMINNGIEEYLGDDKMIVLSRKEGNIVALILDKNIPFTLDNKYDIEVTGDSNPILQEYEKNEWKNKLMNSVAIQTIKERYEKMGIVESSDTSVDNIMSTFMKSVPK